MPLEASDDAGSHAERSRTARWRKPTPVSMAMVAIVALAAGALGWVGGRATAPSTGAGRAQPRLADTTPVPTMPPTSEPVPSTTTTIPVTEINALGKPLPIGYEGLPVPASARSGKPLAHDFCTGSTACTEEVFVLPGTARPEALLAWYDQQMGPTEIPWRNWQPCIATNVADGSPSFAERSWVQPGSRVLRLYLFGADVDNPGPYVRITRGIEDKCSDG